MKKRFHPTPSEPMTIEPEGSKQSAKPPEKPATSRWPEPAEPWAASVVRNANRMKVDPVFRDEIAKKIF
jgi:hypothetical protein